MNILVTGANGFLGKNLCCALENLKNGNDRTRPDLHISEIYRYGRNTGADKLWDFCSKADFVFNLAGVNRPKENAEFMQGNFGFAETLLGILKECGNKCPVMLSSSIQASLEGRFADSEYGKSKLAGEKLFFSYEKETCAKVFVYRFPNLFGKWCKPNYNSAVATFCHNKANGHPITVNDPETELELAYIDDVVTELLDILEDPTKGHRTGEYYSIPIVYRVKLGEIADLLDSFVAVPQTGIIPELPFGSFEKKLYSAYLSYLPESKVKYPLDMKEDSRGSFTEILKTVSSGQFSVNITRPGVTKGQHWHNSKWELFIVVSGKALIRERRIGSDEIMEFKVSGDKIEAVHMIPGYTHELINLSDSEDLVTLMWANEIFDPSHPDTFHEEV